MEINKIHILISGGSGFIGSELADSFSKLGLKVHLLHHESCKNNSIHKENVTCSNWDQINTLSNKSWYIFHCGGISSYLNNNFNELKKANVSMTKSIAKFAENTRSHLVFMSTIGVYDRKIFSGTVNNLTSESSCYPRTLYGKSKLLAEQEIIKENTNHLIIRLPWVYGKNMRKNSHIRKFNEWARAGKLISMFKWPGRVSVLNVNLLSKFCIDIVLGKVKLDNNIINLSENQPISINSFYSNHTKNRLIKLISIPKMSSISRFFPSQLRILMEDYLVYEKQNWNLEKKLHFDNSFSAIDDYWNTPTQ